MKVDADHVLESPAPALQPPVPQSGWRLASILIVASMAAILAVYWQTAASMVGLWQSSETYTHGYLIVPIVLALVWRQRRDLARIAPRIDYLGFLLLGCAGFGWLVATAGGVQVLQQYALVAMIPSVFIALAGRRAALAIAFPLAFLFLAVPFGEAFLPRLMDWTADFTVAALRLTGIPVYREGTFFAIPSGRWSVVEACSGLRYLIASITVGALFAYLSYQRTWKRVLFLALSVAVPIVANFLRAYMIVMIGHLSGMKLAVGVDHFIYGWVFFGIVILLLFWLGSFWRDPAPRERDSGISERAFPAKAATFAGAVFAIVALAAVWPLYAAHLDREAGERGAALLASPQGVGGWSIDAGPGTDWRPQYSGAAASTFEVYRKADRTVALYIGYYRSQRQGAELVSYVNTVVDPSWLRVGSSVRREDFGAGPLELRQTQLRNAGQTLLVWEWFRIGESDLSNPFLAKALLARDKLLGRGDDSAVIILAAPYEVRPDDAAASLREFASDMRLSLNSVLAAAKRGNEL